MGRRQVDDGEVQALGAQCDRVFDDGAVAAVGVEPDVRRQHDLFGIAADVGAVRGQHVTLAGELLGRPADEVPVVGIFGRDAQRAFLAATADADRRVRALRSLRFVAGGLELVGRGSDLPVGGLRLQKLRQDRQRGLEGRRALFGQFADGLNYESCPYILSRF